MDLSTISGITAALFSLFTYTSDLEQFGVPDDHRSYVQAVQKGTPFKDDCDGFALTAVDLFNNAGIKAWTMMVRLPAIRDRKLHMLAVFIDPKTGGVMALDNYYPGSR